MAVKEKYNTKNKHIFLLALIIILGAAALAADNHFIGKKSAYAVESSGEEANIKRYIPTNIDLSIFSDEKYQALVDNMPKQIPNYRPGKANIFEP